MTFFSVKKIIVNPLMIRNFIIIKQRQNLFFKLIRIIIVFVILIIQKPPVNSLHLFPIIRKQRLNP